MTDLSKYRIEPNRQMSIQAKCIHPSGTFIGFSKTELEQSITTRFEQQVAMYPDRVAIKGRDRQFSYDELNKTANRIARAILVHRGEGPENIALLFRHDIIGIAAMIGVLKAGKSHVPLDLSHPNVRMAEILKNSEARLILTDNENFPLGYELVQNNDMLINCDALDLELANQNLGLSISPDAFAYVLYTSGSTGQPKGVIENHRNVLHFSMIFSNRLHVCPADRLSLLAPFAFSGSASVIYPALLNGASVLPFDLKNQDMHSLVDFLTCERITIHSTLALNFRSLVDILSDAEKFPELRVLIVGGDRMNKRDVELYRKYFAPNCILRNGLGSTEVKEISWFLMDKESQLNSDIIPVGYALEDINISIVGSDGNDCGFNQVGEIAIKSRYLSPGYWKNPAANRAAFTPTSEDKSSHIYYSGDIGFMLPDSCLVHLGRQDFQVKIRGHRIEIAEIEAALLALDSVKAGVVLANEDSSGIKRMVAYIVPSKLYRPTFTELRHALSEKLPDYMIPSTFVMLDSLPLTPNGKIDRLALPNPSTIRPKLSAPFVLPRNPLESTLAEIWARELGLDMVGIHDNFFDLGGNSLIAARIFAEIRKIFDKNLPASVLLEVSSIKQQADIIRQKKLPSYLLCPLIAIRTRGHKRPIFLFHGCDGHILIYSWLARHLDSERPIYALRAPGIYGEQLPYTRIEDMASHYIRKMQVAQPEGPYLLGGIGTGGWIAFEVAQQLLAQGKKVDLLAIMEALYHTQPLEEITRMDGLPKSSVRRLFHHLKQGRIGPVFKGIFNRVYGICYWKFAYFPITRRIATVHGRINYIKYVRSKLVIAEWGYHPKAYPGHILYFLSDGYKDGFDADNWYRLAEGGLDVYIVPGSHSSILHEPNVRVLADKLMEYLDEEGCE